MWIHCFHWTACSHDSSYRTKDRAERQLNKSNEDEIEAPPGASHEPKVQAFFVVFAPNFFTAQQLNQVTVTYVFHVVLNAVLLQVGRCLRSVEPLSRVQVGLLKVFPVDLQLVIGVRTKVDWWEKRSSGNISPVLLQTCTLLLINRSDRVCLILRSALFLQLFLILNKEM